MDKKHTIKHINDAREIGKPRLTDGTSVTGSAGITMSENYQGVRVDVGITIPTTFARRKKAMAEVWEFIDGELADKLDDVKKLIQDL